MAKKKGRCKCGRVKSGPRKGRCRKVCKKSKRSPCQRAMSKCLKSKATKARKKRFRAKGLGRKGATKAAHAWCKTKNQKVRKACKRGKKKGGRKKGGIGRPVKVRGLYNWPIQPYALGTIGTYREGA